MNTTAPQAPEEATLPPPRATGNVFPLSTRLATSSTPRDPTLDAADYEQATNANAQRARVKFDRVTLAARLDWVEKLSEPGISLQIMREAARELDKVTYEDLLQERHSLGLCPYPPCSKSASVDYDPNDSTSFRVKIKQGNLYQQVSKGLGEAYCGKWCSARSEWYRGLIARGGEGDLLEDVEERRRASHTVVEIPLPERQPDEEIDTIMLPAPPLPAAGPSMTAMIDSLMIKERPTPTLLPLAPQLSDSLHDFERPSSTTDLSPPPVASSSTSKPFPASTIASSSRPSKKTSTTKRKPPNRTQSLSPFPSSLLPSSPHPTHRSTVTARPLPPPPIGADPRAPPPRFHNDLTVVGMEGLDPYVGVIEAEPDEEEVRLIDEALAVRAMMERGEL